MLRRNNNTINYENISFFKNENSFKTKRKLLLPKINQELKLKNNIKISKILFDNKKITPKLTDNKIFLTLSKEDLKNTKNTLDTKVNNENKIIIKLLNDKITINNNSSSKGKKRKIFKRNLILKKYMNEAIMYRKHIFQQNKINVGTIFKPFSIDKNYYNLDENNQYKKTMDTTLNIKTNRDVKRMRKFKTQDKDIVLHSSINYFKPDLRKINCFLKYKFNQNQIEVNKVNSKVNNLEKKIQFIYDGYRKDAYETLHKTNQEYDENNSL